MELEMEEIIAHADAPAPGREPRPSSLRRQLRALSIKHVRLASRDLKSTIAQLVTPLLVCLLLVLAQQLTNWILTEQIEFPATQRVGRVSPCRVGPGLTNCTTIRYYPGNVPWVRDIMHSLAHTQGLPLAALEPAGSAGLANLETDVSELFNHTLNHPNQTHLAVLWTSACAREAVYCA